MELCIAKMILLTYTSLCFHLSIAIATYMDCQEIYLYTYISGQYEVEHNGFRFHVFCDFTQATGYISLARDAILDDNAMDLNILSDITDHFKIIFFMQIEPRKK